MGDRAKLELVQVWRWSVAYLTDLVFAIVGLLTIAVYGWLLLVGSLAETALLVASSGGLLLGLLASAALRIVITASRPMDTTAPGGEASTAEATEEPRDASSTAPGLETA